MSEHLSPELRARYRRRDMSAGELISADEHLAACEVCRQGTTEAESLDAAFAFLRDDLRAQASAELEHISYEQLEAYIDDQLDLTEREILDSHARICGECAYYLRDLQEFKSSLSARLRSDSPET